MKWKIGLFGALVNVVAVIGILFFSTVTRGGAEFSSYVSVLPILAVSAFIVYYFAVSSYVVKRAGIQKPVFIDSLVGMLVELIIVTLGVVCYSLWDTLSHAYGQAFQAIVTAFTTAILVNLLWVIAMFTVHILIIGNIAGLVGWYLLKGSEPEKPS